MVYRPQWRLRGYENWAKEEWEMYRHLCRESFWFFFLYGFGAALNPKGAKWIDESIHKPMADWFEFHVKEWEDDRRRNAATMASGGAPDPKQKHLAVLVHREIGKTTLFTRAGQAWLHLRDPEIATAIGAEKTELSTKMLQAILAVMDGSDEYSLWPKLFGDWSAKARKWAGKEVIHAARKNTARQDPSFVIFGVETSITGSHPDAIFYDDPISYDRMKTDANWLQTVNDQVSNLVPVVQGDGLIVWVGTRYDSRDHFGVAFEEQGVASLSGMQTDSITPSPEGSIHVYFMAGRDAEGKPTTPKVWPEARLKHYEKTDRIKYASQVMNDPGLSEHNIITREQINQCIVEAKDVPWNALTYGICTDTAFWDGKSAINKCHTVMIVHGYPRDGSGDVYIIEVMGSATWRAEDFAKKLVSTVQRYRQLGRRIRGISDEVAPGKSDAWRLALRNFFNDVGEPMPQFFEFKRQNQGERSNKGERMITAASFWVDGHVKLVKPPFGTDPALLQGFKVLQDQMIRIGTYIIKPNHTMIDYADCHSDAFDPVFYNPMRRVQARVGGYGNSQPIAAEGLDVGQFRSWNNEDRDWMEENPRPPLRNA